MTDTGGLKIAYARCLTEKRDLRAQEAEFGRLGYDQLAEAVAALRPGDTLVVTKLDRLVRWVSDTRVTACTRPGWHGIAAATAAGQP